MSVIYPELLPVGIKENIPFIFPEPLPPVIKEHITDPTGFTAVEKTTLRNAWRIIKRYQRKHARNIFLDFYTENEYMIDRFRTNDGKSNLINTHLLHSHAQTILHIYDRLIEEGFENYAMFHTILTEVAASHKRIMKNETQEVVEKQARACQEYFESILEKINSPTNSAALQKLTDIIISYHT